MARLQRGGVDEGERWRSTQACTRRTHKKTTRLPCKMLLITRDKTRQWRTKEEEEEEVKKTQSEREGGRGRRVGV